MSSLDEHSERLAREALAAAGGDEEAAMNLMLQRLLHERDDDTDVLIHLWAAHLDSLPPAEADRIMERFERLAELKEADESPEEDQPNGVDR